MTRDDQALRNVDAKYDTKNERALGPVSIIVTVATIPHRIPMADPRTRACLPGWNPATRWCLLDTIHLRNGLPNTPLMQRGAYKS